ncbi:hypothetical protein J5N97_025896 [Dioscorea zingiberensis]|uniref:Uncharacterized protein n=1 Tax=Dioscorea zingiberensis TaxID=325984 RepID=A0A9D5H658_9LILI|nr:hypothetical protein J5N97_025896 [Dioscorea zingiberensis]
MGWLFAGIKKDAHFIKLIHGSKWVEPNQKKLVLRDVLTYSLDSLKMRTNWKFLKSLKKEARGLMKEMARRLPDEDVYE